MKERAFNQNNKQNGQQTSTQHQQKNSEKIRKVAESASEPGCARVPGQARFRRIRGGRWKALSIVLHGAREAKTVDSDSVILSLTLQRMLRHTGFSASYLQHTQALCTQCNRLCAEPVPRTLNERARRTTEIALSETFNRDEGGYEDTSLIKSKRDDETTFL